jgi:hypothetical protein
VKNVRQEQHLQSRVSVLSDADIDQILDRVKLVNNDNQRARTQAAKGNIHRSAAVFHVVVQGTESLEPRINSWHGLTMLLASSGLTYTISLWPVVNS